MTISRRQFVQRAGVTGLGLLAGCGRLPWPAAPATAVKVNRVGYLSQANPTVGVHTLNRFRQALNALGYMEGQNLVIESRWGDGSDAPLVEAAVELTHLPVDVLVMVGGLAARIARAGVMTVPIVLAGGGDPVAAGLAASYARPGGNVTGVTDFVGPLFGKRIQLLKEAVPSIARVAILWDRASAGPFPADVRGREVQAVGVQLHALEPRGPEDFDAAFEAAAQAGADALFAPASPLATLHRGRVVELVAGLGWPAMYFERQYVAEGGLMCYAASQAETWQRVAVFVDKLLRGANPAEVPIEQPMTFEFVVNMTTAQALGITFPNEIMLQVTDVIG